MACTIDHTGSIPAAVGNLPESQAGFWRHRCAGCAYLLGRHENEEAENRLRDRVRRLESELAELRGTRRE